VSEEKLDKCKHCGGEATVSRQTNTSDRFGMGVYIEHKIRCSKCGLQITRDSIVNMDSKKAVIEAWNHRYTPWTRFDPKDRATWPEDGQWVIFNIINDIYRDCMYGSYTGVFREGVFWFIYRDRDYDTGTDQDNVQYWMPLPDPMRREDGFDG